VLVVDDDVDSATALGAFLESLGCEVEIAHDGFAALEAAREHRPDAIFLDIGMPGLDGDEVCRRLRREPWGRHVLIAAATAFATARHRERSFRAGFDHYLVKPLDLSTVRLLVRDL
jgi:CheY-like chemotaxis protein